MISKELLGLLDLSGAQILYTHETTKVVVICRDQYLILVAFQVVVPCYKYFNNTQKLTIIDFVLYFHWNHFSQKEHY